MENKNKKLIERDVGIYTTVSNNIKNYRTLKEWTQAKLAEKTGYSHEFIRRIEAPKGIKHFSIDTISHIADALEIDIACLFEGHNKKKD